MRARGTLLVVGSTLILFGGCGGEDQTRGADITAVAVVSSDNPTASSAASNDQPTATSPSAETGAARWEFHLVDKQGWEYDIWIESTLDIVSEVDISDSPPGKARVIDNLTGAASFGATGTLPGRTAPEISGIAITNIRTLTDDAVTLETNNTLNGPVSANQPCYNERLSQFVDDHDSTTWDAWVCPMQVTANGASYLDGTNRSITNRISETDAQAIVSAVKSSAETYLLARVGPGLGECALQLFTDGTLAPHGGSGCTVESDALRDQAGATDSGCPPPEGSAPQTVTFDAPPPLCIYEDKTYTAEIVTSEGPLTVELFVNQAPQTVNNFVTLARYHYYDGISCHRIISGLMAQCGDPTGTGSGGPGYTFADELPTVQDPYKMGVLAMANAGPNTNGSQFFIMLADYPLPPNYSVFGQVTAGLDDTIPALDAAGNPDPDANGVPPAKPVTIESVTIAES